MGSIIHFIAKRVVLILCLVSLLSLLVYAGQIQQLELLSHFRLQYLLVQMACLLVLLCLRQWRWVGIGFILACLNLIPIFPYYWPQAGAAISPSFTLVNLNVLQTNRHFTLVTDFLQQVHPDVVTMEEVDETWVAAMESTLAAYRYQKVIPRSDCFGIALYSKIPLSDIQVHYWGKPYGGRMFPFISAKAHWRGQTFTILVMHPLTPLGGFQVRNSQFADVAFHRPQLGRDLLVVGDFNISPWSPYFADLLHKTGLRDSQLGFGVQPSWPTTFEWLKIPIDHVLISDNFIVKHRKTGPQLGSDHLPVIIELGLREPKETTP